MGLTEEKEKQAAMEEKRRARRGKRRLRGRRPIASDSGGESTWGPTPAGVGEGNPEPTRKPATTSSPGRCGSPPREAARPEPRGLVTTPRWREERWWNEKRMEYRDRGERTWSSPGWAEDRRQPGKRWEDRRGSSPDPRERRRW